MRWLRNIVLAAAFAGAAGCGGGATVATTTGTGGADAGEGGAGGAGGAGGGGGITLVSWVDDLTDNHTTATDLPDTVEDKVGVIIDTEAPAAFDPLLQKQPQ